MATAANAQFVPRGPDACEDLTSLWPANTAITLAQVVSAGAFAPPGIRLTR
jgi:hypothetical protein